MKLVLFRVGDREFGTAISQIREVIRIVDPLPIPDTPSWVEGIIDMRGEVIPVIDLRKKLGFPSDEGGCPLNRVIIVDQPGQSFGMAVEHVTSVIELAPTDINRPGAMLKEAGYVKGVAQIEGNLVPIVDLFLMADFGTRLAGIVRAPEDIADRSESLT